MGLVEGKVALVTGAAGGIGRASALAFAREGARVVVSDTAEDGGRDTVELIRQSGGEAEFVRCDISSEADVKNLIAETVARFGGLDCAHNNAGLGHTQVPLAELDRAGWDRTLAVNLTGTWLCLGAQLAHMKQQGGGTIVATSSATSVRGLANSSGYAATKAGINQLVRVAAAEYAKHGIRVNAVLPGPIDTKILQDAIAKNPGLRTHIEQEVPLGRIGRPEEVAETVVWLCSDRSSFITGVSLLVDGGEVLR